MTARTPNKLDPISEPTLNLRLWAAYLRAGYTRASFARALGVLYNVVLNWDLGRNAISLPYLIKAQGLVGYTLDELVHGHAGFRGKQHEDPLNDDGVRVVIAGMHNVTSEAMEALAEHRDTKAARYRPLTRTYVTSFIGAYMAARAANKSHVSAIRAAANTALNAANAATAALNGRKPLGDLRSRTPTPPPLTPAGSAEKPPPKPRKKILRVPTRGPQSPPH